MRTVDAVTAPVLSAGPKAVTQSPTARAEAAVTSVSDSVVVFAVVTFSFCVLGVLGFFDDFELLVKS